MKTCLSLVKFISHGENNLTQSKHNKCVKYRSVLPNHKKANMGSSPIQHYTEIHLHCVGMIDMKVQNLL